MSPQEFKEAWTAAEDNLRTIPGKTLERFRLNKETYTFLSQVGLPSEAAPFVNFVGDFRQDDKWDSIGLLNERFGFLDADFSRYIVIGSDGSGNVLAINNRQNCRIEWLNHEENFSASYMNASILQMAECFLAYRDYMDAIKKNRAESTTVDYKFPRLQMDLLRKKIAGIDNKALAEGFWNFNLDII